MIEDVRGALMWARKQLVDAAGVEPLDAYILLGHVLGADRAQLLAHPEQALTTEQATRFQDVIAQRSTGAPIAYLIGTHPFFDLPHDLIVTPDVLIPRPETEHLIEAALGWAKDHRVARIADIGTGSGAIAVTLARVLTGAHVWAVDISADALAVARRNAVRYDVQTRMTLLEGDLLAPLLDQGTTCAMVVANLPYIASEEVDTLAVTEHEPRLALDGGADGLDLIRRLLADVPHIVETPGLLLLEIGAGQGERVAALTEQALPGAEVDIVYDLAGHDRIIRAQRGGI